MSVRNAVESVENLPDGSRVFLFGSACYRSHPSDIDILYIYDSKLVPPEDAYARFRPVSNEIARSVGINVHATVLSETEVKESRFLERVEPHELRST
jgi:hypothetical protein